MSLVAVTLQAGQTGLQQFNNVRGFLVQSASIGATFSVDRGGVYPLDSESYEFSPEVVQQYNDTGEPVGEVVCFYPSIGLTPGPHAPLQVVIDTFDGGADVQSGFRATKLNSGTQFNQEGDTPPVASATNPGITAAPILLRSTGGPLKIPSVDNSGNIQTNVNNTVSTAITSQPVPTGASNITSATGTTTAANQNATPPVGTGVCHGFFVTNQATTGPNNLAVADTSANLTAGKLLALVPFGQTSPFIPFAFTGGAGTIFVEGPAAFSWSVTALWG